MIQSANLVQIDALKCRVCGHGDAESLGQIPDCGEFAGQPVSPPIKGGELWECEECGSLFRHPTLSADDYISLYEKAPNTVWVGNEKERNDFATIYEYLKDHKGGSILDIGCYSGCFLAGLSDKFRKYGVEPSVSASTIATSKGIVVLGKTLEEMESSKIFDVVVAIDIIEHVLDVEKFMSRALARVKSNGFLIISTGNPDCYIWKKIFKSKFWYNYFPEHVSFPSYSFFLEFSRRQRLQAPDRIRFSYLKLKLISRVISIFRFVYSYAIYKSLKIVHGITSSNAATAPVMGHGSLIGVFKDHHIVIFKNKSL